MSAAPPGPLVFAHRGASAELPEHTLAAYLRALQDGADGVECDVRLTRDGHLVCVHDRRLNRTSNGRGRVSRHTLAELTALDFGSWHRSADRPPTDRPTADRDGGGPNNAARRTGAASTPDPANLDPANLDPANLDPANLDPAAFDLASLDPAAFDLASLDPAGPNPATLNPAGPNPATLNPAGPNPATLNPAGLNPPGLDPASVDPGAARPTTVQAAGSPPAGCDPAGVDAAALGPTGADPALLDRSTRQPGLLDPTGAHPAVADPAVAGPGVADPTVAGPGVAGLAVPRAGRAGGGPAGAGSGQPATGAGAPDPDRTRLLTLGRLLDAVRDAGREVRVLIETKHPSRYGLDMERRLVTLLRRYGLAEPVPGDPVSVTVMSFSPLAIRQIRLLAPALPTVLLLEVLPPGVRLNRLPFGAQIAGPGMGLIRTRPGLLSALRAAGHPTYAWTVNSRSDLELVLAGGVTGVITDRPRMVLDHLGR